MRRNQIDDVLNISTPTACQDAETVSAATATATLAGQGVPMAWLFLYINMRAPASSFLGFLPFFFGHGARLFTCIWRDKNMNKKSV